MVEKWRKTLDEGGKREAVLTDLFKAFDCIDHNLKKVARIYSFLPH